MMAYRVQNITDEAYQVHTLVADADTVLLTLRFHPAIQAWTIDAEYHGEAVRGVKLAVGCLHIRGANLPFDFAVSDESGFGLDPFHEEDFSSGRCKLWFVDRSEIRGVRGFEVPA